MDPKENQIEETQEEQERIVSYLQLTGHPSAMLSHLIAP